MEQSFLELVRGENSENENLEEYNRLFNDWINQAKVVSLEVNQEIHSVPLPRRISLPSPVVLGATTIIKQIKEKAAQLTDEELQQANAIVNNRRPKRRLLNTNDSVTGDKQRTIESKPSNQAEHGSPFHTRLNLVCNNCNFQTEHFDEMYRHTIKEMLKPHAQLQEIITNEIISCHYECRMTGCAQQYTTPSERNSHEKKHFSFLK